MDPTLTASSSTNGQDHIECISLFLAFKCNMVGRHTAEKLGTVCLCMLWVVHRPHKKSSPGYGNANLYNTSDLALPPKKKPHQAASSVSMLGCTNSPSRPAIFFPFFRKKPFMKSCCLGTEMTSSGSSRRMPCIFGFGLVRT